MEEKEWRLKRHVALVYGLPWIIYLGMALYRVVRQAGDPWTPLVVAILIDMASSLYVIGNRPREE